MFILIIILPLTCEARFGWSFTNYSIITGQQYRIGQRPLWGFELQYDRFSSSCLTHKKYFGIATNYSFNDTYNEIGLKFMWNPTRQVILFSRSIKFYPYLFGQGNYVQTKLQEPLTAGIRKMSGYNFRPGLGVTGNIRETKVISIRTYVQLGFNIPIDNALKPKNPLTFEFKVGIGINARQLKRDKQTIIETEQQDTN